MVFNLLVNRKKSGGYTGKVIILLVVSVLTITGCGFIDVVKNGSIDEIRRAVRKGADVNEISGSGETPLTCAIQFNKKPFEAAQLLINAGANVNTSDAAWGTPLHCAVRMSDIEVSIKLIQLLLDHGAEINSPMGYGKITPLMLASGGTKNFIIAELLIKKGADIHAKDSKRETPLHYAAAINGNSKIIELLILNGADVNAGSPSFTPLHRAAYMGAAENILVLIRNNASINIKDITSEAKTPLELAIDSKQFSAARLLIENGADINTQSYYNYQPFRYRNNTQSYMSKLVNVDLNTIRFERMTPLHRAVSHNNISMVDYLLSKGAKTDIDAHFGGFALDFALFLNYYDIADLLVKNKARSLYADLYLNEAIEAKDLRKTGLLLNIGANIKRKDYNDNTPLHTASKAGYIQIIKLLLTHGADKTVKNRQGKTPADLAADEEIKNILSIK
jgi:ankyrin repeat protein